MTETIPAEDAPRNVTRSLERAEADYQAIQRALVDSWSAYIAMIAARPKMP